MTATLTFTGWGSITDVHCPCEGCDGVLRWAEAGHVPGYRVCDGSAWHHHFALKGDVLVELAERREEGVPVDRTAERRQLVDSDTAGGRRAAEESLGLDGIDVCAYWSGESGRSPGYGTGAGEVAYWGRLTELRPDAVALVRRLQAALPASVSVCNLHTDGVVLLYREYVRGQLGGGTFLAKADAILAAAPRPGVLADDYAVLIGATRGYRVPTK